MKTWMWNADLYCNDCIEETVHRLDAEGVEDDGDSDTYPQDCGNDGGGEADTPQHCGQCREHLENELTSASVDCKVILQSDEHAAVRGTDDRVGQGRQGERGLKFAGEVKRLNGSIAADENQVAVRRETLRFTEAGGELAGFGIAQQRRIGVGERADVVIEARVQRWFVFVEEPAGQKAGRAGRKKSATIH